LWARLPWRVVGQAIRLPWCMVGQAIRLPWCVKRRRLGWGTSILALAGLVLSVPAAAEHGLKPHDAGQGFRVQCVGGTLAGVSTNAISRVFLTDATDLVFFCGKAEFRTPYNKVQTVEYGQLVSRRYAAAVLISPILLLSKERRHYVTLGFLDGQGDRQAVVFRVDKGDIRPLLAALEARTGRRIEYQDDEARKGSKK
jgi:hypothetical protein